MRSLRTATKSSPRSPQLEKACAQQQRPSAAKNKINKTWEEMKEIENFKNNKIWTKILKYLFEDIKELTD